MTYLVSQLWFCLLLAWMLGNIVGWLLRGGCSVHIKRVEQNWRDRYLTLEEEKESYVAQVNKLQLADDEADTLTEQLAKYQEIEKLNSTLKSHVKGVEIGAKVIQADLRAKTQALAKCQNMLTLSKKVIQAKDDTLQKLAKKLKIERHQLNRYKRQVAAYHSQNNKQIETVKIELDKREGELSSAQALLTKKEQSLTELTTTITTKDEALTAYEKQIAEQGESVEMLTATVEIRDEMVEYYEKQVEEYTAKNTTLNNKLEGLANEFAKVASALMQAKSAGAKEKEQRQVREEKEEQLALKLQTVESQLADTDKMLAEKEQELQTLQKRADTQSSPSKLHKLERQLKKMKRKLKAASDITDAIAPAVILKSNINQLDQTFDKNDEEQSAINLLGMNYEIEKIQGVGSGHGQSLRELGITSSHDLLHHVASNQDAQTLAQQLSCKSDDVLWWKKMADFLRIKGVTAEFAQLLALSHMDSAKDVALSNAMQLLDKMKVARKKDRHIRHIPELEDINAWIHDAKTLD